MEKEEIQDWEMKEAAKLRDYGYTSSGTQLAY